MKNPKYYRNRSPEFLEDLIQSLRAALESAGVKSGEARDIANECALAQCKHWGGQLIYFPKADSLHRSARDVAIFNEFDGKNRAELAQKYETSIQWIYRITARMSAEATDRRQGKLFAIVPDSKSGAG